MKRILSILLVLLLVGTAFAGCTSGNGSESQVSVAESQTGDDAELDLDEPPVEVDSQESQNTEGKLIIGLDDHFPPMGYRDEANNLVGFDIDLAVEVANRLGLEPELTPINWAAKEMELANGNVDLLWNGLTITDARKEAMLITPAYLRNAQVILVQADSEIAAIADLAGATVAYQNGSSAYDAIENPENGLLEIAGDTVGYEENVAALNDLEIGRVDALVVDLVVAEYYMARKEGVYKKLTEELAEEEFGIAFEKSNIDLHDQVCQAMADMIADGTAERISQEWFGENRIVFSFEG